jgi:predicted SnoaL-like aldol condensation-catalyzing enzyme
MSESTAAKNKAIVLEAFETLFNKRDYAAAERFWSPNYIQHSAHIAPGRQGLFDLVKSAADDALRELTHHGRRQLSDAARAIHQRRPASRLDRRRYRAA